MFLLDTNVVSELRKARTGRADPRVTAWAAGVPAAAMCVFVVTIEELEIGVRLAEHRDHQRGAILRRWLDEHVLPTFGPRILPIDPSIARRSAALHVPDPRPVRDALIAATALVHGMTVATRNTADFTPTGVPTLDPWTAEPPG